MNSGEIKTKVLHYWRFIRNGYNIVATEAGRFNSDVLVSSGHEIVECEVKISLPDLKKEFYKKKHAIYLNPSKYYSQWIPNKFYFAIPESLLDKTIDICSDTPYGIILVSSEKFRRSKKVSYCKIIKKSAILYKKFNDKLHKQIVMRESSELIRLRIKANGG